MNNNREGNGAVKSSRKSRAFVMAMGGMTVAGMLILIALVWLSDFPGLPHGDVSKFEAPPEDVGRGDPKRSNVGTQNHGWGVVVGGSVSEPGALALGWVLAGADGAGVVDTVISTLPHP